MTDNAVELLGKTIRQQRKLHRLTQQELADLTGISRRHIANIESGKINASFEVVMSLVTKLNISLDNIVFANIGNETNESQEAFQDIAVKLSKCSHEQQQLVLKTINYMLNEMLSNDE